MLSHHRFTAILLAVLIVAAPAAANDIAPSLLHDESELTRQPDAPLIEFDSEDWATFIGGNAPEYQLSALGTATEAFGRTVAADTPQPSGLADERVFTQVWERL